MDKADSIEGLWTKSIRILSGMSGRVIVVCTDEPTALTDAYAFVKLMKYGSHTVRFLRVIITVSKVGDFS